MSKPQFIGYFYDNYSRDTSPVYGDSPEDVLAALDIDDDTDLDGLVILDITDCPRYTVTRETRIVPVTKKV